VAALPSAGAGIDVFGGATATVTGNFVSGSYEGISAGSGSSGSISGNTITNTSIGVAAETDGLSVTSNKIFNVQQEGIGIVFTSLPTIKGNSISNAPIGIKFYCNADNNVLSNAITDATTGVDSVPAGVATNNKYYSVGTIRTGC
jgi:parallel beta-helix repeat protein